MHSFEEELPFDGEDLFNTSTNSFLQELCKSLKASHNLSVTTNSLMPKSRLWWRSWPRCSFSKFSPEQSWRDCQPQTSDWPSYASKPKFLGTQQTTKPKSSRASKQSLWILHPHLTRAIIPLSTTIQLNHSSPSLPICLGVDHLQQMGPVDHFSGLCNRIHSDSHTYIWCCPFIQQLEGGSANSAGKASHKTSTVTRMGPWLLLPLLYWPQKDCSLRHGSSQLILSVLSEPPFD